MHHQVQNGDTGLGDFDWIREGEKFALIGLNIRVAKDFGRLELPDGLIALPSLSFDLPEYWREWIGTIRVEEVRACTLFLVATSPSTQPNILDGESTKLRGRVWHWFTGLVLERSFSLHEESFIADGSREGGKIDVQTFGRIDPAVAAIVMDRNPITTEQVSRAALIGKRLATYAGSWQNKDWRLLRCLEIYRRARNDSDVLDRIHQFTRCIEGLIAPMKMGDIKPDGKRNNQTTTSQFKTRTELFVGSSHHSLMGQLYEVRGEIEHLHEYRHLQARDRATRERLAKLEAIAESIARTCLVRIILDPALTAHFGSVAALGDFWSKSDTERRALWGEPIDPKEPLKGFNFSHVSESELGLGT
jgi:hypothetical protein